MLVFVVLFSLSPLLVHSLDIDDLRAMQRAVEEVKRSEHVRGPVLRQCYPDLGCFSTDGPMGHTGKLPESPAAVGTKYFCYDHADLPAGAHELNPYDPTSLAHVPNDRPVAVLVHGWRNDGSHPTMMTVKDALLKFGGLGSVIAVDWNEGADDTFYTQSAVNTELVGRQVAFLVQSIIKARGVNPKNIHLIGFSLGAQVVGFAGKFSQTEYSWKFGRITGLDAAAPLFESYPGSHLTQDDADYVDAIHSSAGSNILTGEVGMVKAIGSQDFYPSGGKKQPKCSGSGLDLTCNHWCAVLYFEASLSGGRQCSAKQCTNWDDFLANKCSSNVDSRMGYFSADTQGSGAHYSSVNKDYPFCQN